MKDATPSDYTPIIIEAERFPLMDGISSAVLTLSSDSASTLELSFIKGGPEWARYMQPVTLKRRGKTLFHGCITSVSRTSDESGESTEVTVSDFRWLLEHQTFSAQIAAIKEGLNTGFSYLTSVGYAAEYASRSWSRVAESVSITAPGWTTTDAIISLDIQRATAGFGAGAYKNNKLVSAWTVLRDMQAANPDAFYRADYDTGKLQVISLKQADVVTWDTGEMLIHGLETLSAMRESRISGVCVAITYGDSGMEVGTYPADIELEQFGVRFFTASATDYYSARAQKQYMMAQAQVFYEACNELQYSGSLTVRMDSMTDSLLACRLNVTGDGTHAEWADMLAVITSEEWDFLDGTVSLQLGRDFQDPSLDQLEFATFDGADSNNGTTTTQNGDDEWELKSRKPKTTTEGVTTTEDDGELGTVGTVGTLGTFGTLGTCDTPTCDTPTCDTPTCDTPTCDTPTCDTPTCDSPTCDTPTCDAGGSCGIDCKGNWAKQDLFNRIVAEYLYEIDASAFCGRIAQKVNNGMRLEAPALDLGDSALAGGGDGGASMASLARTPAPVLVQVIHSAEQDPAAAQGELAELAATEIQESISNI